MTPQRRVQLQQRSVEGPVDLLEAFLGRGVDQQERGMPQEPRRQDLPTCTFCNQGSWKYRVYSIISLPVFHPPHSPTALPLPLRHTTTNTAETMHKVRMCRGKFLTQRIPFPTRKTSKNGDEHALQARLARMCPEHVCGVGNASTQKSA